ncbi:MAG: hypothetical protein Q8N17_26105 [Burkholderiaceae bacterium]|nr:hypothetical protein [Burkholderiaceae bacterium]
MTNWALAARVRMALVGVSAMSGTFVPVEAPTPPPPPPAPVSAPGGFSLLSSATATAPVTVGQALQQGAIPSGSGIVVTGMTAQVTIKSTWPDGSAKFAIIAGTASLTADTYAPITLAAGTSSSGTALTTSALGTAIGTVVVDAGAFGSATFSGSDWTSPFETWVSGHLMLSCIYRKQIGSDDHLVAWLEVRYYSTGAVEVLPWVENGYLLVASPGAKSETYTFTLGGTDRFSATIDLLHHQRTPLISGTATAHWLGTDPGVTAVHDVDYIQKTGLVPCYHAKTPAGADALVGYASNTAIVTTFTPLQKGNFTEGDGMGGGGFSNHIGLLPEWEVCYLTAPSPVTAKGVIFNGYSLGRYPIHYRDENDGYLPARLSENPTLNLAEPSIGWTTTPATSGTAPPGWAISHQPSAGFLAYLITGRRYFLDEVQFAASTNSMIDLRSTNRENGLGIWKSQTAGNERHFAWCMRSLAQAIAATPDADTTMLGEFRTQFENNLDYYHTRYIGAGGPAAPIFDNGGFVQGSGDVGTGGTGTYWTTIWMQDFITAAFGYAKDLGLGLDSTNTTRLDEFFEWKAQGIVGRFGFTGATEFLYRDFGPYYLPIAPTDTPNWTDGSGPWYFNSGDGWGDIYDVTYSGSASPDGSTVPYSSPGSKVEGDIRIWFITNSGPIAALPALAYAVKHGITGAMAGWQRLTSAENWWEMQQQMDQKPLWAVTWHATPAWLRGQTIDEWRELANTSMYEVGAHPGFEPSSVTRTTDGGTSAGAPWLDAYCGMGADALKSSVWQVANGGHGDYYGNEVIKLDLLADVPLWAEWLQGSDGNVAQTNDYATANYPTDGVFDTERGWYLDDGVIGRAPASGHSYWCTQTLERFRRVVRFPGWSISPPGTGWKDVDGFDMDVAQGTNGWDAKLTYPGAPAGGYTAGSQGGTAVIRPTICKDPRTERVYMISAAGARMWTPPTSEPSGTGTGGSWSTFTAGAANTQAASAVDTTRGRLLVVNGGTATAHHYDLDGGSMTITEVTLTGSPASTIAASSATDGWGMVYVPPLDAFLLKRGTEDGAEIFKIDASDYSVTVYAPTDGASVPESNFIASNNANVYGRWQYLPALRGVVYAPKNAANVWFLRTH